MKEKCVIVLLAILMIAAAIAVSWGLSCGIMWLISLCFNIGFSFKAATGIWLVMWLIGGAFKTVHKSE